MRYVDHLFLNMLELSTHTIIRFLGFIIPIVAREPIDIRVSPSPETQSTLSLGLDIASPREVGIAPPIAPTKQKSIWTFFS